MAEDVPAFGESPGFGAGGFVGGVAEEWPEAYRALIVVCGDAGQGNDFEVWL